MKLPKNKIIIAVGLVGVLIIITGVALMFQAKSALAPKIKIDITEIVSNEPLQAKLEAARAQISALKSEVGILTLEKDKLATELSASFSQITELRVNQQPELLAHYSQLKEKYNRQATELHNLKDTYDALLVEYEELVRVHALCEAE